MSACLALDIGGTFIKLGLMTEGIPCGIPSMARNLRFHASDAASCEPLTGSVTQVPVDSQGSAEEILAALDTALARGMASAKALGVTVSRVGISIPGPFDYLAGVSHMKHKFAAIEGISLLPRVRAAVGGAPAAFLHDSTSFMLGEGWFGAAKGALRPVGVMLGTGFGFAVMQGSKVCVNETQTPALSLWARPLRDGTTEDYVSRRAIRARYAARRPDAGSPDVREIAESARGGDLGALETMRETGELLAEVLSPHLAALRCDRVVLGGQIARSADLLLPGFMARAGVDVRVAAHLDDAALRGAAYYAGADRLSLVMETTEAEMLQWAER